MPVSALMAKDRRGSEVRPICLTAFLSLKRGSRRERPDMFRLLRAIGSFLSRYLNRQTFGAYPHPAADLAVMSQMLKPADVVLVEGKRRISTAIKYLTQSSWSHAVIYVGKRGGVDAEGRVRAFVEADLERGVRAFPIEELEGLHLRICRPEGLTPQDARQVVNHVLGRLGDEYDLKNVFDLARYLLPTPPVPTSWRRRMLALGSSDPTRAICSTLIAEAFETVGFPILPIVGSKAAAALGCPDRAREVQHIRHYRLFVPRDFDVSPYFTIIKPSQCRDYHSLIWVDADQLEFQGKDRRQLNCPMVANEKDNILIDARRLVDRSCGCTSLTRLGRGAKDQMPAGLLKSSVSGNSGWGVSGGGS
jgi:hypothetical protein